MRIGRGYPQQSFTVAGQALGPRRPTVFAPVVTTLSVNLAVGLATNQRRAEMRFPLPGWGPGITQTTEASPQTWGSLSRRLGPTPPELIGPLPSQQQQQIATHLRAVDRVQAGYVRRAPHSQLFGVIGPVPLPVETTVQVTNVAVQSRRLSEKSRYPRQGWEGQTITETGGIGAIGSGTPIASTQFGAAATNEARAVAFVAPTNATATALTVYLARSATVPGDSAQVSLQEDAAGVPSGTPIASTTILGSSLPAQVNLVTNPVVLSLSQPLSGGTTYWVVVERTGAVSVTDSYNAGRTVLSSSYSGAFRSSGVWASANSTLSFSLLTAGDNLGVFRRNLGPRPPLVIDPATSTAAPVVTTIAVLSTAVVQRAQLQRHQPKSLLFPPATLAQPPPAPPVAKTSFVQTRPRPTHPRFAGPVVVFAPPLAPPIDVVFARRVPPRRTKSSLPLVVFAAAAFVAPPINVSLQENRLRGFGRRHFPASVLAPPTTLQAFAGPTVRLVSIRPRKTGWLLRPPTVVRTPSVEQAEQTIRTLLARIRPRPTSANLVPATTLQVFAGPAVTVARLRPRKTAGLLFEPTVLRIPSVEQREDTIFAALVRVRPRPTVRQLGQPTVLRVFAAAKVTLTEARPRPTAAALTPPTVVRVPAVEQLEQTVRVTLTHARPRPTLRRLRSPTVLRVPSVEQQEQTIRARLVQTRPRTTSKHLSPPTVVVTNPPVVTSIRVALVSLRPPLERTRHVVEHLLRPPTVVIPLPSLRAQTITVKLARIRPVRTHVSLAAVSYRAVSDVQTSLVRTRPRRTISVLGEPTVLQTFAGPSTHTVEIRPRPTAAALTAVSFPATSEISVALTRVRPRPTRTLLRPVATLQVFPGPVEHEITVSTVLERRRHAPHSRLLPPTVLAPVQTRPSVSLSRTRPRATLSVLTAPTAAAATRAVQDTLRVALARIRPRRTVSLILPSHVRPPVETSISATFARIRPAATAATLAPPTRVRPQEAFLGPATRLAPGRRPAARPLLSPPTIVAGVAPPTPEQLRLLASLTAIQTRLRFRVGRSVFPAVLPPAPPLTLPPFPESTGYAASGADAPGEALPAADSTGQASPGTASQGIAVPVAESTGKAVPGTASDGG